MSMDIETARGLCRNMIPEIEQISRQFEAALNALESVAALTAQDAEQLLREGKELAAASTLTVTEAVWIVAAQKRSEYIKRETEHIQAGGGN